MMIELFRPQQYAKSERHQTRHGDRRSVPFLHLKNVYASDILFCWKFG